VSTQQPDRRMEQDSLSPLSEPPPRRRALGYVASLLIVALCTLLSWPLQSWLRPDNLVLVYLVGVVVTAAAFGRGPSIVAAIAGVLALDFFFLRPIFSLRIADPRDLLTFLVMLAVGVTTSSLVATIRERGREAAERALRTAQLYALTRDLAAAKTVTELCESAARHVARVFEARAIVLVGSDEASWTVSGAAGAPPDMVAQAAVHAHWTAVNRERMGLGTGRCPESDSLYLPLIAAEQVVGVLVVAPTNPAGTGWTGQTELLANFASQTALALERERLQASVHAAAVSAETERLRSSLLSSLSHDFKTPLAVIEAASSSLLHGLGQLPPGAARDNVALIFDEAQQMTSMANNILDMTRLEASAVELDRQWYPVEELVGSVLTQLRSLIATRPIAVDVPDGLPMLFVDGALVAKLLRNLLENAIKHTPSGTRLAITATVSAGAVEIRVLDEGPGLPPGAAESWFDKFVRGRSKASEPGVGLGLAICRAIANAHGARIWAENRPDRGAAFMVAFPLRPEPEAPGAEVPA
jgi:two-component system sensor histidine kinase KdpD